MPNEPRPQASAGWTSRDFGEEIASPRTLLERGSTAAVVTATAFVVFLMAVQHENTKCGQACFDGSLRTHESGHVWTGYEGAWQWQAEWLMGVFALTCGIGALATSTRYTWRRRTGALVLVAAVLTVGWIAWRLLEPAVPA